MSSVKSAPRSLVISRLIVLCQLLLVLKVVQVFHIEARRQFMPLLCLTIAGFVIHLLLPSSRRPIFFLILSLAGFVLMLGWENALYIVTIGLGLIGVCHLPIPILGRAAMLVLVGAALAYARRNSELGFWPVLGSVFMFRLPIYLREMERTKADTPWSRRLSYFFLLPNACFPFFPIIDYQVFTGAARNADEIGVSQRGIAWMLRGILQLVLYRLIKYQIMPPPDDIHTLNDVVLFLATNYALYLHVSGTFHLIIGMLHLFGFELPRTHDWFFLAHSFTDIWRRINIYWKDFISQHIFMPAFFKLRRTDMEVGIVLAVFAAFLATWLLHSYQVFWLLGDFPLRASEAVLWLTAGVVVGFNSLVDFQAARRGTVPRGKPTLWHCLRRSLQVLGVFVCVSLFWASWSHPQAIPAGFQLSQHSENFSYGWQYLLLSVLTIVAVLAVSFWTSARLPQRVEWLKLRYDRSPLPVIATCLCLVTLGHPTVQEKFSADPSRILASLTVDYPTTLEMARSVPGYYEELTTVNLQTDVMLANEQARPRHRHFMDITRPRNDILELELIPRWKGAFADVPLSINRWGMRDGFVTREKPPQTKRIAVVGSSVVMGYGVRDNEVFTEVLEKLLNESGKFGSDPIEVLNFGVGRYFPLHTAAALRKKVFEFEPDAVFYIAHQGEYYGPVKHIAKFRFARHDLLYPCLDDIIRDAGVTDDTPWGSIEGLIQPHAKKMTQCIYRGIVADCRERGVLPVWLYLPMPGVVEVSMNTDDILASASQAGFTVLDVSHWADGREPGDVKLTESDHHANALGHQLIAAEMYQAIQSKPESIPSGRD